MTGPIPYFHFAGTAREALVFYRDVFDGELELNTFGEFGRTDGPADAIAHGVIQGRVRLYGADAGPSDPVFRPAGVLFSLLGTADPTTLHVWFERLSAGGVVVDPLQARPWGAHDGQVEDRYGVTWLIGYEG